MMAAVIYQLWYCHLNYSDAYHILLMFFLHETFCILIKISLKLGVEDPIDSNTSLLVQAMVWHRAGAKQLPDAMINDLC